MWDEGMLPIPLKLMGFGCELVSRTFKAHKHACVNDRSNNGGGGLAAAAVKT